MYQCLRRMGVAVAMDVRYKEFGDRKTALDMGEEISSDTEFGSEGDECHTMM